MRRTNAFHWTDLIVVPLAVVIAWSSAEGAPPVSTAPIVLTWPAPTPLQLYLPSQDPRPMLIPTQWTARAMPIPTEWDARPMLVRIETGTESGAQK